MRLLTLAEATLCFNRVRSVVIPIYFMINIIVSFLIMRLAVELAVSAHIRVDNFVQAGLQLI